MMSSHSCESGMPPDTAEVGTEGDLVAASEVITDVVTVAALVAAIGQRTTLTAI